MTTLPISVLVVEDEPSVLMFFEDVLIEHGFDAIGARSAGEALNMLGSGMEIAALVCDIRLGMGIDGWEIARCAREVTPDLPIVYVTGDSALAWDAESVPDSRLLQKPFSGVELADALRGLLATVHTPGSA